MSSLTPRWIVLCAVLCCAVALGCGDDAPQPPDGAIDAALDGAIDASRDAAHDGGADAEDATDAGNEDAMIQPDASDCAPPHIVLHESLGGAHVTSNAGITYNSNPPSSGPHCGSWGRYAVYGASRPLPRCNYIHNLEHGAVVLAYKCDGQCPEVVEALSRVRDQIVDAQCVGNKRVILTPDAELDTLIAASAWRTTWTSDCVTDAALESLVAFVNGNLGSNGLAPESGVCSDGSFAP